jgi:hypothetical protein
MAFAVGKFSQAICDRCGFQYKYLELKEEWNGLLVCPECYEPKHPQLEPTYSSADAQALENPRPQVQLAVTVTAGVPNDTFFNSNGMQPSTPSRALLSLTRVGTVTVVIS